MDIDQMVIDIRQLKERVTALENFTAINARYPDTPPIEPIPDAPQDAQVDQPGSARPAVEDQQTA